MITISDVVSVYNIGKVHKFLGVKRPAHICTLDAGGLLLYQTKYRHINEGGFFRCRYMIGNVILRRLNKFQYVRIS